MRDTAPLIEALTNANVQAFWRVVRYCEGTASEDGYRVMFGGGHLAGLDGVPGTLDDFADHPRIVITRTMKGKVYKSSAAGAGQFMPPTWDEMAALYGLPDFSPRSQDIAFVGLLIRRKALEDVIAGRFDEAVFKCRWEWASLPGSPYGQPIKTIEECRAQYEQWGGAYAPATEQMTITGLDAPQIEVANAPDPADTVEVAVDIDTLNQEQNMAPFIAALIPSLVAAVPELAKIFASGSVVSERNIKAAEVVATIAKDALGARNEQEVIEQMAKDPRAAAAVRDSIKDNWYRLVEVGGGIQAAREANAKVQGDRGIAHNPAVWFCASLLPMVYMVVWVVLGPDSGFTSEVKAMVVSAIVITTLGAMVAYFLGTTNSSGKKDDTIKTMAGGRL